MAVLLDLVLPIRYREAGSGRREGPTDIRTMASVTVRLRDIPLATHILAQVMPLTPSIPTVIQDRGKPKCNGSRKEAREIYSQPAFVEWRYWRSGVGGALQASRLMEMQSLLVSLALGL